MMTLFFVNPFYLIAQSSELPTLGVRVLLWSSWMVLVTTRFDPILELDSADPV